MPNLAVVLEDSARRFPHRDAAVLGDHRLTYAQLNIAANQVAQLLAERGIRPGDKVALSCPNTPQFPTIYYGILKAGAAVVPLNILLKASEVAYHLADSEAVAYFCAAGTPELPIGEAGWEAFQATGSCQHFFTIETTAESGADVWHGERLCDLLTGRPAGFETVEPRADDTAVILYTSGTTGQPKGAELSHANLLFNVLATHKLFGEHPDGREVYLCVLPLFHSFGQTVIMNAGLAQGGTLLLQPRFEPRTALRLLRRAGVTFFAGVPTMYWALLEALGDEPGDTHALRMAVSGGASLPVELMSRFNAKFGTEVLEGYGLSETSPVATFNPASEPRAGSIGQPIWGVDCKLVDQQWNDISIAGEIGEIAIRGHNVMKGYYKRPDATAEVMNNGWFRTGDLAYRDDDGYYYIVDRAKDMIIRGGFNVYPREIEETLMQHPAVSLVAVAGVPHPTHGEEVKAFVIRHPGSPTGADELIGWARERLASYKYPRLVEFCDTLPMTSTGKILKRQLT